MWQYLKDQIVTKLKNSNSTKQTKKLNWDNSKTQIVIVIRMTVVAEIVIMTYFSKNTLTPTNSQGSYSQLLPCFVLEYKKGNKTQSGEAISDNYDYSICIKRKSVETYIIINFHTVASRGETERVVRVVRVARVFYRLF